MMYQVVLSLALCVIAALGSSQENGDFEIREELQMLKSIIEAQNMIIKKQGQQLEMMEEDMKKMDMKLESMATGVAFSVYMTVGEYTSTDEPIPFDGVLTNIGGHYDTDTYMFTCPVDGIYVFSYSIYSGMIGGYYSDKYSTADLLVNGTSIAKVRMTEDDPFYVTYNQAGTSVVTECLTGQQVWLESWTSDAKMQGDSDGRQTVFSGVLIQAMVHP